MLIVTRKPLTNRSPVSTRNWRGNAQPKHIGAAGCYRPALKYLVEREVIGHRIVVGQPAVVVAFTGPGAKLKNSKVLLS